MAILGIGVGLFVALRMEQRYTDHEPKWETSMRVAFDPQSIFPDRDLLYILILGTDYNYTNRDIMYTKNSRSDTMILARLDLRNKKLRLLSIPRDTRVQIPGDGNDRINSAYAIGGPHLSETVVQNLIQIPIDYYVRIKEEGLKHLVDAIGGIDVDVEKNMDYDDRWGNLHIHLKKGFQHLNGEKSAEYSRFRHDETGDYGRIERQQKVVKAIQKRFTDPAVLADIPKIVQVAKDNVETDLKFTQLFALASIFKSTRIASVQTFTLPTIPKDYLEGRYWVSYVDLDPGQAQKTLGEFTLPEPTASSNANPSLLRVEVLNGSGIPGKAQEVAERLRNKGFLVARVGNADRFDYTETEIVDHTGQGEGESVAKVLQRGSTLSVPQDPRQVDITVIVGRDE